MQKLHFHRIRSWPQIASTGTGLSRRGIVRNVLGIMRNVLVVSLTLLAAPAFATPESPVVSLATGKIAGRADGAGGAAFLGVPFAAPPVGALRWRAPHGIAPWKGIRDAMREPGPCAQSDFQWNAGGAARSSEDCLYLNVHTPSLHPRQVLPVLVWIHGGSNRAGSADIDTASLARHGIVVVAVQYRLGTLGFLSLPSLSAEQGGSSGNYGLMDQPAALAWVQREIARFGGDPRRVTIAGQSAGAMDVGLLAISAGQRHLFTGAWATGGTPGFGQPVRSLAQSEALGTQLAQRLRSETLEKLRQVPVKQLLATDVQLHNGAITDDSYLWLQAVVDGKVLIESPGSSLACVPATAIPYVLSTNRIELQVPGGRPQIGRRLHQVFGENSAAAARRYGVDGSVAATADPPDGTLVERIGTDTDFRCPGNHVLALYAARGAPAWRVQFSAELHQGPSHHSAELPYLFDGTPLNDAMPPSSLQTYFVNFIKTGDPNGAGLPRWPRFVPGTGAYVDLSAEGVREGTRLGGSICRLFDGV